MNLFFTLQSKKMNPSKLSIQSLKAMAADKTALSLTRSLLNAKAYEQVIREAVEPIQQEVVGFFKFQPSEEVKKRYGETEPLTPKTMYLASNEDHNLYWLECKKLMKERGVPMPDNPDHCPLLCAESMTRECQRELVHLAEKYTGLDFDSLICAGLKTYYSYIDMLLGILTPKAKQHFKELSLVKV
jgi:hypothetical protein